jgi:uncharacterized protein (DUF433 family)
MRWQDVVHQDPETLGGEPVFAGTRVPVAALVAHIEAGDGLDDFLDGFPTVSREQAQAFLELSGELIRTERRDARAA